MIFYGHCFLHEGYERPLQLVLKERKIDFSYEDIRKDIDGGQEEVIESYQLQEKTRGFDLGQDVLMAFGCTAYR